MEFNPFGIRVNFNEHVFQQGTIPEPPAWWFRPPRTGSSAGGDHFSQESHTPVAAGMLDLSQANTLGYWLFDMSCRMPFFSRGGSSGEKRFIYHMFPGVDLGIALFWEKKSVGQDVT